jgi:hypothetical protein
MMHYNKFSQLMLGYLFFDRIGWEWAWLLIPAMPLIYLLHKIDKKHLLVAENEINFESNPHFKKVLKDMEDRIIMEVNK